MSEKILTAIYLHSDKDRMWDKGEHLGLTGEALSLFKYACSEVKVGLEVNTSTGEAKIISIDGKLVAE